MLLTAWDNLPSGMRQSIKSALVSGRIFPRAVERTVASMVTRRDRCIIDMLPGICQRHRTAVDVGANLGGFAWHLAPNVSKVICIEPNPTAAKFLRACNHRKYQILEKAASDRAGGSVPMWVPIRAAGASLARGSLEQSAVQSFAQTQKIVVKTIVLDGLVEDICFVKVDCEGHERAVLSGAQRLVARSQPVLYVEIEQRHCANPIAETFSMIECLFGYQGAYFRGVELEDISQFSLERDQQARFQDSESNEYINNFLFFPKSRASEIYSLVRSSRSF